MIESSRKDGGIDHVWRLPDQGAAYPDAGGRLQASADYGTNAAASFTRFSTIPIGSAKILLADCAAADSSLIPIHDQAETNSLVFLAAGGVARSLPTAAGMRLARALPPAKNPARLRLSLIVNWNNGGNACGGRR